MHPERKRSCTREISQQARFGGVREVEPLTRRTTSPHLRRGSGPPSMRHAAPPPYRLRTWWSSHCSHEPGRRSKREMSTQVTKKKLSRRPPEWVSECCCYWLVAQHGELPWCWKQYLLLNV
ncbi:unnamed protein product [Amoebophrya sp. A25]|nr:unnamed protein product [Amoebophrya sp. A25]|eukprot:GSA25T00023814001.1